MYFKFKNQQPALAVCGESTRLLPRARKHQQNLSSIALSSDKDELGVYLILVCFTTFGLISAAYEPMSLNLVAVMKQLTFSCGGHSIGSESQDITYWLASTPFFLPNVIGGLVAATLCSLYPRSQLLGGLSVLAAVACFLVAGAGAGHFAGRFLAGFSMGGSVPVIYSICGDFFAVSQRVKVCGLISTITSMSFLLGQGISTALGPARWRLSCMLLACPSLASGLLILLSTEDPMRAGKEHLFDVFGRHDKTLPSVLSLIRAVGSIAGKRTNLVVLLQSFPGNIVLGIVLASLNGSLKEELLPPFGSARVGALVTLGAAFVGMLFGGYIGEVLYSMQPRYLALFSGACSVLRVLPLMLVLAVQPWGFAKHEGLRILLFIFLGIAGVATTASPPCLSAMLLNANPADSRGLVISFQAFLDEVSKGLGACLVVLALRLSNTSGVAALPGVHRTFGESTTMGFEMIGWCATLLSVLSGIALLAACGSYEEEEALLEAQLKEQIEVVARQQKVQFTKQRAQIAVQRLARAAGEAHHTECKYTYPPADYVETPALTLLHGALPQPPANGKSSWHQWWSSMLTWLKDQQLAWSSMSNSR